MARFCQNCGAELDEGAKFCNSCGAAVEGNSQAVTNQNQPAALSQQHSGSKKSKATAGILGILLGGLGAHKFYLGKTGKGILYLLLCWTFIPGIIGFIEGIQYLIMSDEDFDRKFN